MKRKFKFENYKNCSGDSQLESKINHLEKYNTDIDILKSNHKKFIVNSKLILKTQQRFKSERHNVFTEESNKIS